MYIYWIISCAFWVKKIFSLLSLFVTFFYFVCWLLLSRSCERICALSELNILNSFFCAQNKKKTHVFVPICTRLRRHLDFYWIYVFEMSVWDDKSEQKVLQTVARTAKSWARKSISFVSLRNVEGGEGKHWACDFHHFPLNEHKDCRFFFALSLSFALFQKYCYEMIEIIHEKKIEPISATCWQKKSYYSHGNIFILSGNFFRWNC